MVQALKLKFPNREEENADRSWFKPIVITRRSRGRIYWDFLISLLMTFSYFMVPYHIAFAVGGFGERQRVLEFGLDVVILVDVLLNFITDSYSDPGKQLGNRQIAFKYITSYFLVDVLSFLPSMLMLERQHGAHWVQILKLIRYCKIKRTFEALEEFLKLQTGMFREHVSFNIRYVFITMFQFVLIFHLMACLWVMLGNCNDPTSFAYCGDALTTNNFAWIEHDRFNRGDQYGISNVPAERQDAYIYWTSFYFITTTASTIGYGDYGAKSWQEMYFLIFVEFVGMIVFSIISGAYKKIIQVPTVQDVINSKTHDITMYLQRVDQLREEPLPDKIYDQILDYIQKSYRFGVVQTVMVENSFYRSIPPDLKNKLIFLLLTGYYDKFFYFFNDCQNQQFADTVFVRKILSRLDCVIFAQQDRIVQAGHPFHCLYFLYKGAVTLVDRDFKFQIARLPEESFFGDFQLLMGTLSEMNYVASSEKDTWCMTVDAQEFH